MIESVAFALRVKQLSAFMWFEFAGGGAHLQMQFSKLSLCGLQHRVDATDYMQVSVVLIFSVLGVIWESNIKRGHRDADKVKMIRSFDGKQSGKCQRKCTAFCTCHIIPCTLIYCMQKDQMYTASDFCCTDHVVQSFVFLLFYHQENIHLRWKITGQLY